MFINIFVIFRNEGSHMLPCHGLGCVMTNAKLVYWSGNFYLFCIAKSRVSLTAFIPRVLGIRLHVRTCKSLLCTTFGLLHHSPQSTYFDRCCQTQRRLWWGFSTLWCHFWLKIKLILCIYWSIASLRSKYKPYITAVYKEMGFPRGLVVARSFRQSGRMVVVPLDHRRFFSERNERKILVIVWNKNSK